MATHPDTDAAFDFTRQVERFYAGLTSAATASATNSEPGLGGLLLYAGELDGDGRALAVAGNIAGAASIVASAGAAAQKQAIRDGVVDFLVTSLDEALRILKNEIRKQQPVSVCVTAAPETLEREMLDRGVQPGLVACGLHDAPRFPAWLGNSALQVKLSPISKGQAWLNWSVAAEPTRWLPKLDALALDCLSLSDWSARRWVRLAPRYLGRLGQGVRVLSCSPEDAREFIARVQLAVKQGEIGVQVFICYGDNEQSFVTQPKPSTVSEGVIEG